MSSKNAALPERKKEERTKQKKEERKKKEIRLIEIKKERRKKESKKKWRKEKISKKYPKGVLMCVCFILQEKWALIYKKHTCLICL